MTDRIDPKVIADELREAARDAASERYVVEWDKALVEQMLTRAADTIDALVKEMHARELHHSEEEQKSAGLAAVIEKLGLVSKECPSITTVDALLSATPADVLREHDAALIESLADGVDLPRSIATWDYSREQVAGYRDAERDIEAWLRERARQVREGAKK